MEAQVTIHANPGGGGHRGPRATKPEVYEPDEPGHHENEDFDHQLSRVEPPGRDG